MPAGCGNSRMAGIMSTGRPSRRPNARSSATCWPARPCARAPICWPRSASPPVRNALCIRPDGRGRAAYLVARWAGRVRRVTSRQCDGHPQRHPLTPRGLGALCAHAGRRPRLSDDLLASLCRPGRRTTSRPGRLGARLSAPPLGTRLTARHDVAVGGLRSGLDRPGPARRIP